jgi:hypothetical protein
VRSKVRGADHGGFTAVALRDRMQTNEAWRALMTLGHLRTVTVVNRVNRCPTVIVPTARRKFAPNMIWSPADFRGGLEGTCSWKPRTASLSTKVRRRELAEEHRKGAFLALSKMSDEGMIRAWGIGVNTPQPILNVLKSCRSRCLFVRPTVFVDRWLQRRERGFPAVREKNVSLVIWSALNAGFISGSPRYNHGKDDFRIPAVAIEKPEKLRTVAARSGVDLRTAALQFSSEADVAVALIVGARSDRQIQENTIRCKPRSQPNSGTISNSKGWSRPTRRSARLTTG